MGEGGFTDGMSDRDWALEQVVADAPAVIVPAGHPRGEGRVDDEPTHRGDGCELPDEPAAQRGSDRRSQRPHDTR
jgi:hypothetical protein